MNYKILDKCFKNTTRKSFIVFIIITLEYLNIFMEIISIASRLLNKTQETGIIQELNLINPYFAIQNVQTCTNAGNYNLCTFSDSAKNFLLVFIFVFFILYFCNSNYEEEQIVTLASESDKKTFMAKFFSRTTRIFSNFIFHLFGLILLFVFTNFLMFFVYSVSVGALSEVAYNVVIFIFSAFFYYLFLKFYLSYATSLNVIVQFHKELSYHSDNLFSRKYDYFLIYLKIIITITDNLIIFEWENSFQQGTINYKILFCSILIICSLFVFTLSISVKVLGKGILYLINARYNVFRIFMLHFTMFFLIFLICFRYQLNEPIVFTITVLTIFALAIYVTFLITEKNRNTLYNENMIYQVAHVISKKHIQSDDELNEAIYHMFMIHKLNCDKNANYLYDYENSTTIKENICQICEESEYTFENFLKSFYSQIKFMMRNKIETFSVEEMELFTMIRLLYISILQKHKIVKLYFKIVEILRNPLYQNKSMSLCLNINRLKNYINNDNLESIRIFKILKTYQETSDLLRRIIDISEDIYTFYEFEKDIYKRAEQINIARDEISRKIVSLVKFSVGYKDSEDLYSLILFKKIYEELFNTNIDNLYYNFNQIEVELKISEKYATDKFLTILYDVSKDSFLITKASNEMKVFNKKKLEEIFPDDFKSFARERFLKLIRENEVDNFRFEFLIKNPVDEIYFQNVFLKGRVCPSINFNELIINTTFEISKKDFILFEENFMTNNKKILKSFSKNVGEMLCMTSAMLKNYNSYKLYFEDIFKNQNNEGTHNGTQMAKSITHIDEITQIECEMNLFHYINLCLNINSIHNSNDGEQIINLLQLKKLKNSKTIPKFVLNLKEEIKRGYTTFLIYSIALQNKGRQTSTEDITEELDDEFLSEKEQKVLTHPSTPSVLSYMSNAEKELAYFQNSKQSQKSKSSTINLSRLTTIASLFILFLISYSIIFMVIGIIDNQKLKETYSILMTFTQLKKIVYNTYSSVFNKFLLTDPSGVYNKESYNIFFSNLDKSSTVNMSFDTVAMIELTSKIDLIQQEMLQFQYVYLSSYYKDQVNLIVNTEIEYNELSVVNNQYSVILKSNNIFDNLKTFMNLAQIIFEVTDLVQLDTINYNEGNIDFSNIENKNYDAKQNFGLEIIINYLNIFQQAEIICDQLQIIQNDKLQSIYMLTLIFFITFILFHMSLVMICFYIIRSLRNLIANYLKLIDDLFTNKNIVYVKKKLSILKNLNELYFEDPAKLLNKLKFKKKAFNQKNRQDRKDKEKKEGMNFLDMDSIENYSKWENSKKFKSSRNELITPIIKMIVLLFALFYIYAFIFYFFITSGHEKFAQSSLIFLLNSSNEDKLFNNYNLFEFMIFTNTTDTYLFDKLSNQTGVERSYIKNEIQKVQDQTYQILSIINKNQVFDDDIINLLYKENSNLNELRTFFIEICESLPFMQDGDVNMVLQEINYGMQQILFQYKSNIYNKTEIVTIYNQPTLYNLYYYLLYIYRPIEQDINYNLINSLVSTQQSQYLLILMVFLSLNIAVDAVILIIIKHMMIKKVLNISTYIENFIDAIKIV